jgi:hypothetical protein
LKNLATEVGVSYPTLRKMVDEMIAELRDLKKSDEMRVTSILEGVEKGYIPADVGI